MLLAGAKLMALLKLLSRPNWDTLSSLTSKMTSGSSHFADRRHSSVYFFRAFLRSAAWICLADPCHLRLIQYFLGVLLAHSVYTQSLNMTMRSNLLRQS